MFVKRLIIYNPGTFFGLKSKPIVRKIVSISHFERYIKAINNLFSYDVSIWMIMHVFLFKTPTMFSKFVQIF